MRRRIILAIGIGLGTAATAEASPDYPATLRDELALSCEPSCLLCHTIDVGGFGTANTPFGAALRRVSLECCQEDQIVPALDKLSVSKADGDQDGIADVTELRAGTDPNALDAGLPCGKPRGNYGCQIVKDGRGSTLPSFLILLWLAAWRRRRRYGQVIGIGNGVGL